MKRLKIENGLGINHDELRLGAQISVNNQFLQTPNSVGNTNMNGNQYNNKFESEIVERNNQFVGEQLCQN